MLFRLRSLEGCMAAALVLSHPLGRFVHDSLQQRRILAQRDRRADALEGFLEQQGDLLAALGLAVG